MLALIYLGLAVFLADLLCRRFYRFVSTAHRWAAATLVGIFLSTWFTHLAGLALAHSTEAFMIAPRAPGSSKWDWLTLGALVAAASVLLIGTLYVTKQGRLRFSGTRTSDFAPQLAIAQS